MLRIITKFGQWIKKQICQMNLFQVEIILLANFNLRKAILSTRIYIILLTIILTFLTIYSTLDTQDQTVTIQNPSQSVFENLSNQFSNTLTCPCMEMTVPYESFISITIDYHPICSSIFISDIWINSLFNLNISYFYPLDFRSSANGQFQLLSSLCSLVKRFINDAIDDFLSDTLLTPIVLSPYLLDIQSQTQSSFVRTSTNNAFQRSLQLIRSITFSNQLQTALQTSAVNLLFILDNTQITQYISQASFFNANNIICYCGSQSTCSSSISGFFNLYAYDTGGFYTSSMSALITNVTGFVVGCYAIESLLQSTLQCYFDSTYLNIVFRFFPNINRINNGWLR